MILGIPGIEVGVGQSGVQLEGLIPVHLERMIVPVVHLDSNQDLALDIPVDDQPVGVVTFCLVPGEHDFQGLRLPSHDDWRKSLLGFFSDFRDAALTHPTLAKLLSTGQITIPAVFDILETSFQQMIEDGLPAEEAVRTFYAGLTYTIGFVLWEIPRAHSQPEGDYEDQWAGLLSQLDPDEFPVLTGVTAAAAPTVASSRQFDWGLRRILAT